jgi:hypothetical protein
MKQQMPGTDPAKPVVTARVIHGAVMAGIVIIFAVFLYLRTQGAPEMAADTGRVLRILGYAMLVIPVFGSGVARGRIPPRRRGEDLAEWWAANLNGAVVVWVLAEGGGLGAMALGWLTGDTNLLALGAAVALAVLFVNRPSRFQGET